MLCGAVILKVWCGGPLGISETLLWGSWVHNPKMLIVFFILMFLSSSLTVTEVYVLCLFCFHIRRNKKIELENMYFVAVAVWNCFSGKILKPVNIDLKFRTCMISAQKSVSCTEQNLNKYSLNKWRQSPYIFLTNYISVINDVISSHRECLEYRQAPCFQTFRFIYLLINHEYTNYHFHLLRQWFFPWKKENVCVFFC